MALPLANGPGFSLQVLAFLAPQSLYALRAFHCNLTRPTHNIPQYNIYSHQNKLYLHKGVTRFAKA
jgi:hypothetical protein